MRYFVRVSIVWITLISSTFASEPLLIVTEDLPPMQIVKNDRVVDGIAYHKVKKLLNTANIEGQWLVAPWSRAYKMALTRPNVLLYSIVRTAERENKFNWVAPIYLMEIYLVSLKNKAIDVADMESAKGHFIGVKRNDVVYEYLLKNGYSTNRNLVVLRDTEDTFKAMYKGRVDLVAANRAMIEAFCSTHPCHVDDFELNVHLTDMQQNFYLAASIGTDPHILSSLERVVSTMRNKNGLANPVIE